jgi:hypothetical protein
MTVAPWKRRGLTLALAMTLALGFAGCSDDDDDTDSFNEPTTQAVWEDGAGGYYARIDASASDSWTRLDLDGRAFGGAAWTLGFRRSEVVLNGGDSGTGTVTALNLAELGLMPSGGFAALAGVDPSIETADWITDQNINPLEGWYNYNPMTHEITPSDSVFVVRTADGLHYAKFQIGGIADVAMSHPGTLTIDYVYQATANSYDLSAAPQSMTIDCSTGSAYFSFATGGAVTVADPGTSMAWDIMLDGWDLHFNAGSNGPGSAGGYSAQLVDLAHADVIQAAPTPALYLAESVVSVFSSWYDYDGATHQLSPVDCVYLVNDGTRTWKVQLLSYYNPATDASGWYKIRFAQLP